MPRSLKGRKSTRHAGLSSFITNHSSFNNQMIASFKKYTLNFRQASGTSRGVYTTRDSWFIFLSDGTYTGIGECAPLPDLSVESLYKMSSKLLQVCEEIDYFCALPEELHAWPSIVFGLETALLDLKNGGQQQIY